MRLANIMLGKGLGGIEQAAIDYGEALLAAGHEVVMVHHPQAAIVARLPVSLSQCRSLPNAGHWDIVASWRLRLLLRRTGCDAVMTHGNRAFRLAQRAVGTQWPVVAVSHNYQFHSLRPANHVLAITQHMKNAMITAGWEAQRITVMPNVVRLAEAITPRPQTHPPVIGAIGRLVAKKGFEDWIRALAIVRGRGGEFRALLAGTGAEAHSLQEMIEDLSLEEHVTMVGWVDQPTTFYEQLNVFCVPSHHEPFGIVVLEAMAAGVPVIATASEGPKEILTHGHDGLLVARASPPELATAILDLLHHPEKAETLAHHAYTTISQRYTLAHLSQRLNAVLVALPLHP